MKKLISVLLMSLLFICSTCAAADTEDGPIGGDIGLFYAYTKNITANLSISSGGVATSRGMITLRDPSYTCSIIVKLQRKSDGSWKTIATWRDSGQGYAGASAGGTKNVASGYSYRVSVSATVKNASGHVIERPVKNSSVKSY